MAVKTLYQAEDGQLFETYHAAVEHEFIEIVAVAITECPTVYTPNNNARSIAKHLLANYNIEVKKPLWDDAANQQALDKITDALMAVTKEPAESAQSGQERELCRAAGQAGAYPQGRRQGDSGHWNANHRGQGAATGGDDVAGTHLRAGLQGLLVWVSAWTLGP